MGEKKIIVVKSIEAVPLNPLTIRCVGVHIFTCTVTSFRNNFFLRCFSLMFAAGESNIDKRKLYVGGTSSLDIPVDSFYMRFILMVKETSNFREFFRYRYRTNSVSKIVNF
jgi:hypothetical protein